MQPEVDLKKTYDAIVVGSGAAGGMAAHVLTSHGMQVLLLEAGKKLDINKELKSMQWPYEHPRRGDARLPRTFRPRIHYPPAALRQRLTL
jgi:choline dehydrogenase-like flavoprotein